MAVTFNMSDIELYEPVKPVEPVPTDLKQLRMDLHLALLNANSALVQLFQTIPLTPDEIMLLHYIEEYLGVAR